MKRSWVIALLMLISLAEALNTGRRLFFNLTYLLAAVIVVSFVLTWTNLMNLHLSREMTSQRSRVGDVAEERFLLHNRGWMYKLWVEVRDYSDLPDHRAGRVIGTLAARHSRGWSVRTMCRKRGRYRLGPVELISGDPFGLFERRVRLPRATALVVYPMTFPLSQFALPAGHSPSGGALRRRTHYVTTNVAGIRDYAPGDSFNRIHWPSTARTSRLMVKEFELDPTTDVMLILDTHRLVQSSLAVAAPEGSPAPFSGQPVLNPSTEEYAVTIAATLAEHLLASGRQVGLVAHSRHREMVAPDRGERQMSKIMDTLAVIRATGPVPIAQVIAAEGRALGHNTVAVVITASDDPDWAGNLRDLRRRGLRSAAVVLDGATFGRPTNTAGVLAALAESGIPAWRIGAGDAIGEVLAQPVRDMHVPL